MKKLFSIAALLIALGIIAGAFGAHGIKGTVSAVRFEAFQTGVLYHLINSVGLLVIVLAERLNFLDQLWTKRISLLLLGGIVLFSGSLYILVIFDLPYLGAITPFGGTMLIAAWLLTAFAAIKSNN